jgi:hypothetical protein
MTTGEVLDRTFNLYRNNFVLFAGISALAAVFLVACTALLLVLGLNAPAPGARVDPQYMQTVFIDLAIYMVVIGLFYLIGGSFAMGATIYAVSKVHLGQPVNIGESYRRVWPLLGRIINIVLSIGIRMVGVFLLIYLGMVAVGILLGLALRGGGVIAGLLLGLVVFGGIIGGYIFIARLYFKYSLAVPACVLENIKATPSLKRSTFLSKGSLGRIFLIYLLMGIIGAALSLVLQLPANLFVRSAPSVAIGWQLVGTFLAFSFSFPISTIAICLVYYDQRVKKEAFDLQMMMDALGQPGPAQAVSAAPIG